MPKRKSPYTGILARPMDRRLASDSDEFRSLSAGKPAGTIATGPMSEERRRKRIEELRPNAEAHAAQIGEKFVALLAHYEIPLPDDEAWGKLAVRLVMDHVPGFQTAKKPGRARKWDFKEQMKLVGDVESVKREGGCSDVQACRILIQRAKKSKSGPYRLNKANQSPEQAAKSLNSRLVEARAETDILFKPMRQKGIDWVALLASSGITNITNR